jgi:hypothetical protein
MSIPTAVGDLRITIGYFLKIGKVFGPSKRIEQKQETNMRLIPCVLLAICMNVIAASESAHFRDFRIGVSSTPKTDDPEQTLYDGAFSATPTTAGDDTGLEQNLRFSLMFLESIGDIGSFGGLMLGLGFTHSEQRADADQASVVAPVSLDGGMKRSVNVVDVSLAYAFRVWKRAHLEAGGFGGLGASTTSHRAVASTGDNVWFRSGSEMYYEYGLKAGLFYTFASQLQLGAEAGWLESHSENTIRYPLVGGGTLRHDVEIDTSGPFAGITLGVRF